MSIFEPSPKEKARQIILDNASRKGDIVYGTQSLNQQVATHLKRKTEDYDVLTYNPEESAKKLAEKLNFLYGEERFRVEKGKYHRTYKVKDSEGTTIADYTKFKGRMPKTVNILGVKYADLNYSKSKARKILRDEMSAYRWDKDRDTLRRIREANRRIW